MSGPWEKYKSASSEENGPWSNYQPKEKPAEKESTQAQAALEGYGQGATLGYLPQIQAATAPVTNAILEGIAKSKLGADLLGVPQGVDVDNGTYLERRDENIKRNQNLAAENPWTYGGSALVGGLATGAMTAGMMPAAGAATAGGRILNATKAGAIYGAVANPGDQDGVINVTQIPDRLKNTAKGAAVGGILGAAFEGGSQALQGSARGAENVAAKFKKWIIEEKPDAKEIEAAAKALGFKPTPGMVTDSQVVQNLESSLSQSPSIPGMLVRGQQKKIAAGLQKGAQSLTDDASQLTKFEAGEQAKKQIIDNVDKRFQGPIEIFDDLRQYTKDIHATDKSVKAVSNNINKIPQIATFEDGTAAGIAKSINKVLEKKPSADQIKELRTMVGAEAKAAEKLGGSDTKAIWDIYHKLGRLEENTIKRGVLASARTDAEGKRIAEGMLGQLKSAKKGYSKQMGNLKDVGKVTGIKDTQSPKFFNQAVDDMQSEKVADKFFNLGNNAQRQKTKEVFPEAFQTLRKQRLSEIRDKSMAKGKLDPSRLIRQVDKLDDEALRDLFRESVGKASSMKKVMDSFPDKVGPSGTPQGLQYSSVWDLAQRQVTDFGRYGAYKTLSSPTLRSIGHRLQKLPEFKSLAETNPEGFNVVVGNFTRALEGSPKSLPKVAEEKLLKGHDKFANDGFEKLKTSVSPEKIARYERLKKEFMASKKGKDILSQISTLKPGTKAFDHAVQQLDKLEVE